MLLKYHEQICVALLLLLQETIKDYNLQRVFCAGSVATSLRVLGAGLVISLSFFALKYDIDIFGAL